MRWADFMGTISVRGSPAEKICYTSDSPVGSLAAGGSELRGYI